MPPPPSEWEAAVAGLQESISLYLPISPYISLYLPISAYISPISPAFMGLQESVAGALGGVAEEAKEHWERLLETPAAVELRLVRVRVRVRVGLG